MDDTNMKLHEFAMGYSMAAFSALKVHLKSMSKNERAAFCREYRSQLEEIKEMYII